LDRILVDVLRGHKSPVLVARHAEAHSFPLRERILRLMDAVGISFAMA
jgi:hypothetical protein